MLSFISWGQFFTCLAIGLLLYYLFIAFAYYGSELQALLKGNPKPSPSLATASPMKASVMGAIREQPGQSFQPLPQRETGTHQRQQLEQEDDDEYEEPSSDQPSEAEIAAAHEEMEILGDRLKAMMERTGIRTSRSELMEKVIRELKAFASVMDIAPLKPALFPFLQQQSSELCDIELEDSDMDAIWNILHNRNKSESHES